jgi:hypothetical protein
MLCSDRLVGECSLHVAVRRMWCWCDMVVSVAADSCNQELVMGQSAAGSP